MDPARRGARGCELRKPWLAPGAGMQARQEGGGGAARARRCWDLGETGRWAANPTPSCSFQHQRFARPASRASARQAQASTASARSRPARAPQAAWQSAEREPLV